MFIQNAAPVIEEFAEPQRGVGRNGLFFARDAFDPGTRHVQRGGDRVRRQLERNEKFFPQDFAGMYRRKFLCHGGHIRPVWLVIVDYLYIFGTRIGAAWR
jgi:hypothetical protein